MIINKYIDVSLVVTAIIEKNNPINTMENNDFGSFETKYFKFDIINKKKNIDKTSKLNSIKSTFNENGPT